MNTVVSHLPSAAPDTTEPSEQPDLQAAFDKQRDTALRLRTSTPAERIAKIKRLLEAVQSYMPQWYEAGEADFKKPPAEMDLTEILPVVSEAKDAMRHLKKWMKPHKVRPTRMMLGNSAWVQYEPKGRCLIISPWNYPVNLTFGPLISAIAAGNTAIIKPSEMTPHLSALMGKIVREVFPEDEVALFEGDAGTSQALLELPFDHIFFTGSPAIGKVVMAAAAKHLTSVTLELGGKSPTIVDETANLKAAARNVLWGKFTNNGQTCIAPDHIYVHENVREAFIGHCVQALEDAYGKTAADQLKSRSLARVVNQRHTQRIGGLLDDARQQGAKVLFGGDVSVDECFIAPTLLSDIPRSARIMDEEIFGPILPVIGYTDLDAVIAEINAQPKPLAMYVWSKSELNIHKLLQNTSSGGACINMTVMQFVHGNLPFGGVNNSGIGNAHGEYGFKAFSHERAVLRARLPAAFLFYPPYTKTTSKIVKLLLKIL